MFFTGPAHPDNIRIINKITMVPILFLKRIAFIISNLLPNCEKLSVVSKADFFQKNKFTPENLKQSFKKFELLALVQLKSTSFKN